MRFFKTFFILIFPFVIFANDVTNNNISVEEHLEKQQLFTDEVIKNINSEKYLQHEFNERDYDKQINYLLNRININKRNKNDIAVVRDEIKLLQLQEQRFFINTLKEIIDAKNSLKDKKYILNLIKENIDLIEKNPIQKFSATHENELNEDNKISKELVQNYEELLKQNDQQLYALKYMLDNINLYRKTNFLIDEFNIQYIINKIDSFSGISTLSKFSSYHFKFSIGEILVVLLILLFFRLLNKKIITIFINFLNRIFLNNYIDNHKDEQDIDDDVKVYIKKSIGKPLIYALYLFSIHISLHILVKNPETLNEITPWINTIYMGLLSWAIYSLLSNSISNFAQHLVDKYPNVRREMIVFILRILKIIFIILVVLFLFTELGIDIKAIAASLGVGGIAIALAAKDTLANFFGSLNIMTDNSFSQGDWIVTNNIEGTVVDIRMRTTRVRTFDNAMITVPNSEIANAHIKNYSKRRIGRRIKMSLGVTYESNMEDIINLKNDILEMLENHPDIASPKNEIQSRSKKFEAIKREDLQGVKRNLMVYIDEYANSSINILIYCFTRSPDWEEWLRVKEDVIIQIHQLMKKNNCEFAYPTQTLHLKQE